MVGEAAAAGWLANVLLILVGSRRSLRGQLKNAVGFVGNGDPLLGVM